MGTNTQSGGFKVVIRQIWPLAVEEIKDIFSKKRSILFFILYIGMVLLTMQYIANVGNYLKENPHLEKLIEGISSFLISDKTGKTIDTYFWPIEIYVFQFVSIIQLPYWISMISCDMISTDRYRGTLRFILLRSFKSSYYFSKTFAHFMLYGIFQLCAMIVFLVCWKFMNSDKSILDMIQPCIVMYAMYLMYMLMVITVTQTISSLCVKTITAMVSCMLYWFLAAMLTHYFINISPYGGHVVGGLTLPQSDFLGTAVFNISCWIFVLTICGFGIFRSKEY
jgi:Cu-processing system permease protein